MFAELWSRDVPVIFTDGLSAVEPGIGRLAGYGVYLANHTAIVSHMPELYHQTNNSAQLMATLRALQLFTSGEIAASTASEYVILGTAGAFFRTSLPCFAKGTAPHTVGQTRPCHTLGEGPVSCHDRR